MKDNYEIISLFPTPLLKVSLPPTLSKIIPWFNKQPMRGNTQDKNQDVFGQISQNTYILNNDICEDLRNIILKHALELGNLLGYDYEDYRFTQSWISYKHPKQSHERHTHTNSLISGVFYYDSPSPLNSLPIIFHKSISSFNTPVLHPKITNTNNTPFSTDFIPIECQPGNLILFPSYLHHSVPENTTDKVRKSLAFNIVPKNGFGEEYTLNELKFN